MMNQKDTVVRSMLIFLCVLLTETAPRSVYTVPVSADVKIRELAETFRSPKRSINIGSVMSNNSYLEKRKEIMLTEQQQRVGGEIVLTPDEEKLNEKLLKMKQMEIDNAHFKGGTFAPQLNFLKAAPLYKQSDVFKLIQKMPKGGVLHSHDCSILTIEKVVRAFTYLDNCYMCTDRQNSINFRFFSAPPVNPDCPWHLVNDLRKQSGDPSVFDDMLVQSMVLNQSSINENLDQVWERFNGILTRVTGIVNYAPVFRDYFLMALEDFYADNVQYVEVRALLPEVYDLNGRVLSASEIMDIYVNATETFKAKNPGFTGAKIIKSELRFKTRDEILADIKNTIQLIEQYPDYLRGYDLVGQEDKLNPLLYYLDALLYPSSQTPPIDLPYFFHAGETFWQGTSTDNNLVDAVLLNTTRIGHGYALTKHPEVMKIVKQRQIPVEINPISNQVLKLVDSLQNHPGAELLAEGFPVVISCDDPAVWGAVGLSYDFYATFMALAGRDDGLQLLKQLAMNSLIYSAMNDTEKATALRSWENSWNVFVQQALSHLL